MILVIVLVLINIVPQNRETFAELGVNVVPLIGGGQNLEFENGKMVKIK